MTANDDLKIVANGMDMKVFQDKGADAQRWHLYNRMNDIILLVHRHVNRNTDQQDKCFRRFKRLEKFAFTSILLSVLVVGVLLGLGILKWEMIKPFILT